MPFESITDEKIHHLVTCEKRVNNPTKRFKVQSGHEKVDYQVSALSDDESFLLFMRQNKFPGMEDDFSCGLIWLSPGGESLVLRRYNGSSHNHKNHLEKEKLGFNCHIHEATQKYIIAGKKPAGYAAVTKKYETLAGALHALVTDCNISGIKTQIDAAAQLRMFEPS